MKGTIVEGTKGSYRLQQKLDKREISFIACDDESQFVVKIKPKLEPPKGTSDGIDEEWCKEIYWRERSALERLCHPRIPKLHDAEKEGNERFLVLEYIPSLDLELYMQRKPFSNAEVAELIKRISEDEKVELIKKPLSETEAVEIAKKVCLVLEYVHDQELVHRDVKPGNILVTAKKELYLADFGLSARFGEPVSESVLGTPHYIAPEGWNSIIDYRSDIYSLGIVLYECLTGEVPFDEESIYVLAKAHEKRQPCPPHYLCPQVSETLSYIVCKALEKDADKRFQSAREFHDALDSYAVAQIHQTSE